jgi:hypothetical protein
MANEPTPQQIENARRAGWNPDDGEPPYGWDAHGTPPEVDPDLGHNGVPAPHPDDDDFDQYPPELQESIRASLEGGGG